MRLILCAALVTLMLLIALTACSPADSCPVSEPVWEKPPEDSAVQNPPEFGYYFVNEDRSMWASAWWANEESLLSKYDDGIKVGWFRREEAELVITGQRLDASAPLLESHIPCCYPTCFQSAGLYFPAEGCWEVTARAADSELSFTVWVEREKRSIACITLILFQLNAA
jgi:hypothetical protein